MTVYIFKRNKKTGQKTEVRTAESDDEARELCKGYNKMSARHWYEFTGDKEQLR